MSEDMGPLEFNLDEADRKRIEHAADDIRRQRERQNERDARRERNSREAA